jgi:DNA-directed RNA polymerase specialized sigma24 family protein
MLPGGTPEVTGISAHDDLFHSLIQRIRAGDQAACTEFYNSFAGCTYIVIRRRLSHKVRAVRDVEDIVQSVLAAFFRQVNQYQDMTRERVIALLRGIARHQIDDTNRHHLDGKGASRHRQHSLDALPARAREGLVAPQPGPEAILQQKEAYQHLIDRYPPMQRVIELLAAGHTPEEIAVRLGVSARLVQRFVTKVRHLVAG